MTSTDKPSHTQVVGTLGDLLSPEVLDQVAKWTDARTSIQAPEGSDLAAAAAAEQDADARVVLALAATRAARDEYNRAQAAYDQATAEQAAATDAWAAARRAHIAAMRAAGVAQTADGYVTR